MSLLKYRTIILLLLVFSGAEGLFGQKVQVSGVVRDSITEELLPVVKVILEDTDVGVNTNLNGDYAFYVAPGTYVLLVKYSGYRSWREEIVVGEQGIENKVIDLVPVNYGLQGLTITSKAVNPAIRVVKNAIRNRRKNKFDKIDAYEYESYNKLVITFDNVNHKLVHNKLMKKDVQATFDKKLGLADSTRFTMAGFISESVSRFYYRRPDLKKEEILAIRTSGMKNQGFNMLSSMFLQIDLYDNNVIILDKLFRSPIADGALIDYDFHLMSADIDGRDTLYGIEIIPKRPQDMVFKGTMYIDNHDWAINRIDISLNSDPNINFVEDIRIRQEYIKREGNWVPQLLDLEVDFQNGLVRRKGGDGMGLIGRSSAYLYDYKFDQPKEPAFYMQKVMDRLEGAMEKDSSYWAEKRRSPLEEYEKTGFSVVDSLTHSGMLDMYIKLGHLAGHGNVKFKKFEVGSYFFLLGYNRAEGVRTRIDFKTRPEFSERFYFNGHLAYGFGDRRLKYLANARYKFRVDPKLQVGFLKSYEVEQVGFADFVDYGTSLFRTALRRVPLTQLSYAGENRLYFQGDLARSLSVEASIKTRSFEPTSTFPFAFKSSATDQVSEFSTAELGVQARIRFKQKYLTKFGERKYIGSNKWPLVYLTYRAGFNNFLGGQFDYHNVSMSIEDWMKFGRFGWFKYKLQGGKILGTLPYPNLYNFPGNQTWGYDDEGFNMMNYYEFIANDWVTLSIDHHFEGFFLNNIPLFRKLKFKEVVTARAAWGQLSQANLEANAVDIPLANGGIFEQRIKAPSHEPYLEAGAGLENILKFFRVDAIWRLNYHDLRFRTDPDLFPKGNWGPRNNFGIRFAFAVSF